MKRHPADRAAPPAEIHRLFFALWPDNATRARIQAAAELLRQSQRSRGRWLKPHRYHMTLHFLGDFSGMPEALAARACAGAAQIRARAFDLSLDRAGSFRKRAPVWWLGCIQPPARLMELWDALAGKLRDAEVAFDAKLPLTPHVTVLRDSDVVLPLTSISPVHWRVDEFVLMDSRPGAQSEYRVLARWALQHGDAGPDPP